MSGFTYFIRSGDRIKIGFSEEPARRLVKIRADAPYPCDLLGAVCARAFPEREVHARFAEFRVRAEWFHAAQPILDFVASESTWARPDERSKSRLAALDPAAAIISKLGGEAVVSRITGTSFTAPYRWQYPTTKHGTGGRVPHWHIPALLAFARSSGISLDAAEFFAPAEPSQVAA